MYTMKLKLKKMSRNSSLNMYTMKLKRSKMSNFDIEILSIVQTLSPLVLLTVEKIG